MKGEYELRLVLNIACFNARDCLIFNMHACAHARQKRSMLALMKSANFVGFVGCCRVELHDKVVDGVNYQGKVFVRPLFKEANGAKRHEQRFRMIG